MQTISKEDFHLEVKALYKRIKKHIDDLTNIKGATSENRDLEIIEQLNALKLQKYLLSSIDEELIDLEEEKWIIKREKLTQQYLAIEEVYLLNEPH